MMITVIIKTLNITKDMTRTWKKCAEDLPYQAEFCNPTGRTDTDGPKES
jgi:hypothetical protein